MHLKRATLAALAWGSTGMIQPVPPSLTEATVDVPPRLLSLATSETANMTSRSPLFSEERPADLYRYYGMS